MPRKPEGINAGMKVSKTKDKIVKNKHNTEQNKIEYITPAFIPFGTLKGRSADMIQRWKITVCYKANQYKTE